MVYSWGEKSKNILYVNIYALSNSFQKTKNSGESKRTNARMNAPCLSHLSILNTCVSLCGVPPSGKNQKSINMILTKKQF